MDKVDDYYIWQRRVFHATRNQKGKVPFPESVGIGVEFNAAVERQRKLDPSLLTHNVLMEICDFAKTVTTAEKYFLFEVMMFNFDLGVDTTDHKLCYQLAVRIHGKIMRKKVKPQCLTDVFLLPDISIIRAYVDKKSSDCQIPQNNFFSNQSIYPHHWLSEQQPMASTVVLKKEQEATKHKETRYPFCEESGVSLVIGPSESDKRKLHLDVLTNGLMMELLDFSRVLSSSFTNIFNTLLEHNFGIQACQVPKVMFEKRKAMDWMEATAMKKEPLLFSNGDAKEDLLANSYMCPLDFEAEMQLAAGYEVVKEEHRELLVTATQGISEGHMGEHSYEETQEDATKQKLWVLRGHYSRQILTLQRARSRFERCQEIGLDFDIGSGVKQALQLEVLTNSILMEVQQFATAINKGLVSFLSDILERNFNMGFLGDHTKQTFITNFIRKWKDLLTHPNKGHSEFLNDNFSLPHIHDGGKEVESTKCPSSSSDMEPYPFCKKMGVDFWATDGNKLPLAALTVGAVLEIFQFVGILCGSTRELVKDILEHNFTLDLQSADSEAAVVFQKWCTGVFQKPSGGKWFVRRPNTFPRDTWLDMPVFTQANLENDDARMPSEQKTEVTSIQVDDFHACKKIGLDLHMGSKWEAKKKLSLQQLTRGILLEVHRYLQQNRLRYVPSLYKILEYNFELGYQSPHKVEFAWSLASQVIAMARKSHRNENYLNTVFELPFQVPASTPLRCKEEQQEELLDPASDQDIVFVQKLKPVDIEVEIE